ncbi:hypothetical protein ACHAPA_004559 [Fusarium lateritium]
MRFSSILPTATLVVSIMGAVVPLPGNSVAIERLEAHGGGGSGLRKRDEGYSDDAGLQRRDKGYSNDDGLQKRDEGYSDDAGK